MAVNPKIPFSVILPVYGKDHPQYFLDALQSLANQTAPADEVLVIEDGPLSAELYDVLNRAAHFLPNLKRLPLAANVGLSEALNIGLTNATHAWVARMDSDDLCMPHRFEKQLEFIAKNPDIAVVGSWTDEFEEDQNTVKGQRQVPATTQAIIDFAKWRCPFNHVTVFYKKSVILGLGAYTSAPGNHRGYGDDYTLWGRVLTNGCAVANLQESLVKVRTNADFYRKRRRGWVYFKSEKAEISELKKIGLINTWQFMVHVCAKFVIRMMPAPVLKLVYATLRKK